jgi:uncharacterized protein YbaP (TraB family)
MLWDFSDTAAAEQLVPAEEHQAVFVAVGALHYN